MLKSFSVLNSDRINKYNYLIPLPVLEDMMWMKATEGVPMHIGHDMHRPIGCMIPYALYFEPKLVRSIGLSLLPETDEESEQILNLKRYSQAKHIKEDLDKNNGELFKILESSLSKNYKYISAGTLAIFDKNIVRAYFPELVKLKNKDKARLINVKDLEKDFKTVAKRMRIFTKVPAIPPCEIWQIPFTLLLLFKSTILNVSCNCIVLLSQCSNRTSAACAEVDTCTQFLDLIPPS